MPKRMDFTDFIVKAKDELVFRRINLIYINRNQ